MKDGEIETAEAVGVKQTPLSAVPSVEEIFLMNWVLLPPGRLSPEWREVEENKLES